MSQLHEVNHGNPQMTIAFQGLPLDEARTVIDEKIRSCEKQILELKTYRNLCTPVGKLSSEVLLAIFIFVRDGTAVHNPTANISWIRTITHICGSWRSIALGSVILWNTPPTDFDTWALIMLRRSKNLPLNIHIRRQSTRGFNVALEKRQKRVNAGVFSHMSRIQDLTLEMDHFSLEKLQTFMNEEIRDLSAPLLQRLVISSSPNEAYQWQFRLKPSTFKQTSRLRDLELVNTQIQWSSPLLHNLTNFSNRITCTMLNTMVTTWEEMTSALTLMPMLQAMDLSLPLPSEETDITCVVHLDHLRRLTLDFDLPSQIRRFLSSIKAAHLDNLSISCTKFDYGAESHATTLQSIYNTMPSSFWACICAMRVHLNCSSDRRDQLQMFSTSRLSQNPETSSLHVRLARPGGDHDMDDFESSPKFLTDILNHIHLPILTSIDYIGPLGKDSLVTSFGRLPDLTSLSVSGRTAFNLIKALSDSMTGSAPLWFPALSSITLNDVALREISGLKEGEVRNQLEVCITRRREQGTSLQNLNVVRCCRRFSEVLQDIRRLETINVEWDGLVMHFADDSDMEDDESKQTMDQGGVDCGDMEDGINLDGDIEYSEAEEYDDKEEEDGEEEPEEEEEEEEECENGNT